jgi:hypothetical protein
MDTMTSIQATERQRELREAGEQRRELRDEAEHVRAEPRTQVRRWVQLKHMFGTGEERWGRANGAARERRRERLGADPACATC